MFLVDFYSTIFRARHFAARCKKYRDDHMLANDLPDAIQMQLWDKTLAENIFVICKTPMAKSITRRTLRGFRDVKVNARYFEDLINTIQNKSKQFIDRVSNGKSYWKANNITNMKFNAIVGNPPYQEIKATANNTTNSAFASAMYPYFMNIAIDLKPQYVSMIMPSRWMTKQGQGVSDDWADRMIECNHFISINDYLNSSNLFPTVEIKGGVSYFLFSKDYIGKCDFYSHDNSGILQRYDYLDPIKARIVIRSPKAMSIINKVSAIEGNYFLSLNFSGLVSPQHFYDKAGVLSTSWDGYVKVKDNEHPVKYYLNKNLERCGYAWISKNDIPKNAESMKLHKVYIPKAGGTGNDPVVLGTPFYGEPGSVCSQTYVQISFDSNNHDYTKEECLNIISYIKTRFFRYMVSIKKRTQDVISSSFQFVPLQDFSESWTDEKLYKKYNLTEDEIAYIESLIKPME